MKAWKLSVLLCDIKDAWKKHSSSPSMWRSRVVEQGGGAGWWSRVVEQGGGAGWWSRVLTLRWVCDGTA